MQPVANTHGYRASLTMSGAVWCEGRVLGWVRNRKDSEIEAPGEWWVIPAQGMTLVGVGFDRQIDAARALIEATARPVQPKGVGNPGGYGGELMDGGW